LIALTPEGPSLAATSLAGQPIQTKPLILLNALRRQRQAVSQRLNASKPTATAHREQLIL
jgi:hypothetical protein